MRFETETIADPDMFIGEEKIITEGVEGERKLFYTEKYVDGELEEVAFKNEKISKKPVNEVKKVVVARSILNIIFTWLLGIIMGLPGIFIATIISRILSVCFIWLMILIQLFW